MIAKERYCVRESVKEFEYSEKYVTANAMCSGKNVSSCNLSTDRVCETLEIQSMLFQICAGRIRCAFHLSAYKVSAQIIFSRNMSKNLRRVLHTVACCPYFCRTYIIVVIFMSFQNLLNPLAMCRYKS